MCQIFTSNEIKIENVANFWPFREAYYTRVDDILT